MFYYFNVIFLFLMSAKAAFKNDFQTNSINDKPIIEGENILTWCTISQLELEKCEKLMKAVMLEKVRFEKDFIEIRCKRAFDTEECMTMLDQREASLLALDPGEVYIAGRFHSLVPIMQEVYGRNESYQYAVAVVNKGGLPSVQAGTGLFGVKGARACFPSVGSLAGWVMPIYTLMLEGGLKITDCNNHVKSAINYFGESCAPNSLKDMYNPIGDNSVKLCQICAGGYGTRCTLQDPYAGYEGALRCLVANGTGDIAFVRDSTIRHALLSRKILGDVTEDRFELLCRDGSRRPVTQWEECNWGRVPADAIVTTSAATAEQRRRYQNLLMKLVQLYGEPNPLNSKLNVTSASGFQRFTSTSEGPQSYSYDYRRDRFNDRSFEQSGRGNVNSTPAPYIQRLDLSGQPIDPPFYLFRSNGTTDLLLQDSTVNLIKLKEEQQSAQFVLNNEYVGEQAELSIRHIRDCPIKRAAICVTSDAEMEKCFKMKIAMNSASLTPKLSCWRGYSARDCARAVAEGSCDLVNLDAGDMLYAAYKYHLVPFMQEVYSSGETWFYAVAVTKEQDPDTDITYLRGKNTCHTGIGMAAGWIYPLAYLISNGWIRPYGCDGAQAASQYFTKSCAPGALSSEYIDSGTVPHDNLCHLCHGASMRRCRRDASEDYYGHYGALRCMVEGGGDVAFVRHTVPTEVSGGRRKEWWARDLLPDDIQLLCPDGTRAKLDEYEHCNLGKVPGSVLMGRANHTELDAYTNLMMYAQQYFGAEATDDFSFSLFYSSPPYSDLIFSNSAVRLKPLKHHERSAELIAGPALLRAVRIVSCDAPQASYYVAPNPDFLSHASRIGLYGHVIVLHLFLVAILR